MGGGQEWLKRKKLDQAISELSTVNFSISNNSGPECYSFYDGDKIFQIIETDIKNFFLRNGIKSQKETVGDMGGGVLSTIMECLQLFRDEFSQFGLIISTLKLVGNIFSVIFLWYKNYWYYHSLSLRPRLTLTLSISSNKEFDSKLIGEFQSVFSIHLANLTALGKAVLEDIRKAHPLIDLNLHLTSRINHINFHCEIQVESEMQKEYNFHRLMSWLKMLVITPNASKEYSITKWGAIRRKDSYFAGSEIIKNRIYFFFISRKILSDYFGIKSQTYQLG